MPWASVTELRALAWAALGRRKKGLPPLSHLALGWSSRRKWGHLERDATVLPVVELWKQPRRPRGYALLQDLGALSTAMKTSKQRWATCALMVEWTRRNTNIYARWLTVCPLVDLLRVWGVSFSRCTAESWQEVICWYFSSSKNSHRTVLKEI